MCIYPVVRQLALELIVRECNIARSTHVALAATLASIVATVATYPIQKWRIMLHSGELAPKVVDKWHYHKFSNLREIFSSDLVSKLMKGI